MAPPVSGIKLNKDGIPPFESLPLRRGDPFFSAWGLYGDDDELGTLNRLTDSRVASAAKNEIRTGARVSLNWPLNAQPKGAFFSRRVFHQELFQKFSRFINDDVWTFNTQSSSQWDGLRHYGYQKAEKFYNGVTMEQVHRENDQGERSTINGIQAWAEHGIVGRGILVDYHTWRLQQGLEFDAFSRTSIPIKDLQACLKAQGTEVKFGDILFIRSGWMVAHAEKSEEELFARQQTTPHTFAGVEQSDDTLRWLWENFSAVAGDQPAFECWPTKIDYAMHEVLLGGWGCPIGELFFLEKLADQCKKEKRWSFFVSSEPCNVPGGVASPPNILAIF